MKHVNGTKNKMKKAVLGFWKTKEIKITKLIFADDMVTIANTEKDLYFNLRALYEELNRVNMVINEKKTKATILAKDDKIHNIELNGRRLEQVNSFKYLGRKFQDI